MKEYKLGIIIPNCNYEDWLDKCLGSIANQTYKNFEVIFIDDMSSDNSVNKAKEYQDKMNIKIIELKQKRLNGGARNEGYLHLSDDVEYVMYVDSDDWLIDNLALEKINKALQNNPDVLFIGIADCKNDITKECYIPEYNSEYQAIEGWSGSCGKVIKKDLATRQECLYKEGTLKEDRNQHRRICLYMKSFECLKEPLYVWNRNNLKSVTSIQSPLWLTSTIRHYADTKELYETEKGRDEIFDKILEEAVRKTKIEMELGGYKQW